MTQTPAKKSDLGVRTLSAIVMLAVAGGALWMGGWWWAVLVALVGFGVLYEWIQLSHKISTERIVKLAWIGAGIFYIGFGCWVIVQHRNFVPDPKFDPNAPLITTVLLVLSVIAVDVGAYFAGRAIGGPKIAPSISPSKTWAGLGGGILGVFLIQSAYRFWFNPWYSGWHPDTTASHVVGVLALSIPIAAVAQAGDFFESWMKRRAGVKDSGNLIPGHGGLFDRLDGLLAVAFLVGVLSLPVGIWIL